jgi:hypothetical protein
MTLELSAMMVQTYIYGRCQTILEYHERSRRVQNILEYLVRSPEGSNQEGHTGLGPVAPLGLQNQEREKSWSATPYIRGWGCTKTHQERAPLP